MKKTYRILLLLAFLFGSNVYPLDFARASDLYPNQPTYNQTTEIRSDVGIHSPNVQIGQHGYRVFTPGAIAEVQVSANGMFGIQATITRYGATDVWL